MKNEQEFATVTEVHLDLTDRIKVLFGKIIKVETKILVPIKEGSEIEMYNGRSRVKLIGKSKSHFEQDKPTYGYSPVE